MNFTGGCERDKAVTELSGVPLSFRSDINGLRAWAVFAVIAYHFGIPGFGGGFVGVDVFFVISGFLMTGIVIKGLERRTFSMLAFYIARARRIVPALLVLCVSLLALGWVLLLPPDYKMLSSHSVYALMFLSNVEFWQEAGYFDLSSHEKWLLHTWSLSVEWQYYLILPLLLWSVWQVRPGRKAQKWAIGIALVVSLAASLWTTGAHPSAAFYLLHTRAWELLGGGGVFLIAGRGMMSARYSRWVEWIGLVLIVLAIVVFDKDTTWPGWQAVLPVIAAMLVLLANRTSPFTNNYFAQWLGKRSYSLYLWHWPVVVSTVYFDLQDNLWVLLGALVLTALLGHLSYAWIESPSRRWLACRNSSFSGVCLALAAAAVVLPALIVWKHQGVPGRFSPSVELAAAEATNINPRREFCLLREGLKMPSCVFGGTDWKVILLGDSHASALVSGLAKAQTKGDAGVVEWSYIRCAFVAEQRKTPAMLIRWGKDHKCSEFIELVQAQLMSVEVPPAVPIVIVSRYALAAFGPNEDRSFIEAPEVYFSKVNESSNPEFLAEFAEKITSSACELAKRRRVYMVRPIPEMGFNVPKKLSRRMAMGANNDLYISYEVYQKRNGWVWRAQDAARDRCGIRILDPIPYLCRNGRCYGSQNGRPLYSDDNHLSEFGNEVIVPMFAEVFQAF